MARSISVKVPTATLVATIEAKIAEIDEAIANYPRLRDEYEKANEAHKARLAEFVSDYLAKNISKIGYDYDETIRITRSYGDKVSLEFDTEAIAGFPEKPTEPERPNSQRYYGRDYSTQKELLEKNLKILKMTSQEEVSASTYGAVMELL
jgi:hypothetical protein